MPPGTLPEPSGQWLLTISFYSVGQAAGVNYAELIENYEATFVLQPVESRCSYQLVKKVIVSNRLLDAEDLALHKVESDSTDSEDSWGRILDWLPACVSSHDICSKAYNQKNPRYYPSRLIEIGDEVDDLVYLRESNEANFSGDYIAVSHCWGKTRITKLVRTPKQELEMEDLDSSTTSGLPTMSHSKSSGPKEDQDASIPREETESEGPGSPSPSITSSRHNLTKYIQDPDSWFAPQESKAEDSQSTASSDEDSIGSTEGQDIRISREEFMAGIPSSELPQTFQDAISVTRRLQIRYLWIDSLCILQDSPEDWDHESAQMHLVYGNAYVTLAADDSRNSSEGLFRDRFPSLVTPIIVATAWKEALAKKFVVIPRRFWSESVAESPLNRRAWVLQERYLSPRIIHFGETQILWECKSRDCCETFPDGIPELAQDINTRFKGDNFHVDGSRLRQANLKGDQEPSDTEDDVPTDAVTDSIPYHSHSNDTAGPSAEHENRDGRSNATEETSADQIAHSKARGSKGDGVSSPVGPKCKIRSLNGYYVWSRLLEKYSKTTITFPTDRLVALFGLAKIMSEALEDEYLAGLWKSILPSQLLWRVGQFTPISILDVGEEPDRALQDRANPSALRIRLAPSWSWASVEGAISTSRPSRKGSLVHIMPLSVGDSISIAGLRLPSLEPMMLIIQGDLHIARLRYLPNVNHWMVFMDKRGKRVFQRTHGSTGNNARFVPDEIEHDGTEKDYMGIAAAYPDSTPPKDVQRVFCLPIMRRKRTRALQREEYGYTTETVSGLMVLPERNGPLCQWRRIGCFDSLPDEAKVDWGTEYCYGEHNEILFSEGPRGLDDTVVWLR